jgi:hypothetical protein
MFRLNQPQAETTEGAAVADQIIGQIEERFPNWRSYRDLIDCIDCTLHQLRSDAVALTHSQAESASVREVELEEALKNLMGIYDTPVSRRRYPQDQFMKEALDIARAALTRPQRGTTDA